MTADKPVQVSGFGLSHIGKVRHRNEDSIYIEPEGKFALVADGMGGHRGGREASRMTIEAMSTALAEQYETLLTSSPEDVRNALRIEFRNVSTLVYQRGLDDPSLNNMGTTLVTWLLLVNTIYLAHVGDSRAYLIRDKKIFQMTMDHTFVNEQINMGVPRAQVANIVVRNAIFRNIGVYPPSEPSIFGMTAERDDLWLICTDGLSNLVECEMMLSQAIDTRATEKGNAFLPALAQRLVQTAYSRGGDDNISVVLLHLS